MTVSTTTSRADYTGNGATTAFAVPFYFLDNSHLLVIRTQISTGIGTTLALGTDYTVSGAGVSSGGTLTCTAVPTTDQRISILRNVPFVQLAHYVPNDPFPAATHEQALDLLTMEVQQLGEAQSRSLTLSPSSSGVSTALPNPVSARLIGWNAAGTGLANYDTADLTTVIGYGQTSVLKASGDGVTTAFTLTSIGASVNNVQVHIHGVRQTPGVDYTLDASGYVVTFTTAPPSGANNILLVWQSALPVGAVPDGSVTVQKLSATGTPSAATYLRGDNTWAPGGVTLLRFARTSNTVLTSGNAASLIDITSGTFTQTFDACAALGNGWWCYIRNNGTGDITLDPAGSETIDGLSSFVMYPGEVRLVMCDGTTLQSVVVNAFSKTFTANGTFTKPPGYAQFSGLLWGGGGGGSTSVGGGGGACVPFTLPSSAVSASTAVTVATASATGGQGGDSSFAGVTAYGGANGTSSTFGGGGGGAFSAGSGQIGGAPSSSGFNGGNGSGSTGVVGVSSAYGGGGGGRSSAGGQSLYGGGGGGSSAGTSVFGGSGGASGAAGSAPAGGGGTGSTTGARGELRIWGVI